MIKKYYLIGFVFCLLVLMPSLVKADTVTIYDTFNSSNYKFIELDEFGNIPYVDSYQYEVILNGNFLGYYSKNEHIYYPNNSNLTIIIPSLIKTSTDNIWESNIKPQIYLFIGFLLSWGLGLLILIAIIGFIGYRIYRKITKGY